MYTTKKTLYEKHIKKKEEYDQRVKEIKELEEKKKVRENAIKKSEAITMSKFNKEIKRPERNGWYDRNDRNSRERNGRYERNGWRSNNSTQSNNDKRDNWKRPSRPNNSNGWRNEAKEKPKSELDMIKDMIKNKKFLPPHYKKIAKENGLL